MAPSCALAGASGTTVELASLVKAGVAAVWKRCGGRAGGHKPPVHTLGTTTSSASMLLLLKVRAATVRHLSLARPSPPLPLNATPRFLRRHRQGARRGRGSTAAARGGRAAAGQQQAIARVHRMAPDSGGRGPGAPGAVCGSVYFFHVGVINLRRSAHV